MLQLQPITSIKKGNGLKEIYDLVEENVGNLSSLALLSDRYGNLLVHLVKFENNRHCLRLVISREIDDKVWDIKIMLKYFKKEIFANERCALLVNKNPYNLNKQMNYNVSIFIRLPSRTFPNEM